MEYQARKSGISLVKLKKFIYLISPTNIKGNKFYRELDLEYFKDQ